MGVYPSPWDGTMGNRVMIQHLRTPVKALSRGWSSGRGPVQDQFQTLLNHQYNHPEWYKDMQPYWDAIPTPQEMSKLNMKEDLLHYLQEPSMVRCCPSAGIVPEFWIRLMKSCINFVGKGCFRLAASCSHSRVYQGVSKNPPFGHQTWRRTAGSARATRSHFSWFSDSGRLLF